MCLPSPLQGSRAVLRTRDGPGRGEMPYSKFSPVTGKDYIKGAPKVGFPNPPVPERQSTAVNAPGWAASGIISYFMVSFSPAKGR